MREKLERGEFVAAPGLQDMITAVIANMANGGLTPMRTVAELQAIGYALAIFPSLTGLVAAAALEQALRALKDRGERDPPLFDFREFCGLIGFDQVWDFERKWTQP